MKHGFGGKQFYVVALLASLPSFPLHAAPEPEGVVFEVHGTHGATPAQMTASDPKGRVTGRNAAADAPHRNIPDSEYVSEMTKQGIELTKIKLQPAEPGEYLVSLIASADGRYQFSCKFRKEHRFGEFNSGTLYLTPAEPLSFRVTITPAGAADVVEVVDLTTLRTDVRVARAQGQIADDAANGLLARIEAAGQPGKSTDRGEVNALAGLVRELRAQSGKSVKPAAAQVLINDAEALAATLKLK